MIEDIVPNLVLAIVKILAAIVLSVNAAYAGMSLLDRLTTQLDEWKEIKKGNVAVGILYSIVILSVVLLAEPQITDFVLALSFDLGSVAVLAFAFFNYLLSIVLAIIVIYLAIHMADKITNDVEEFTELKKGNVAIALVLSAILLAVVVGLMVPFESIFETLKAIELSLV